MPGMPSGENQSWESQAWGRKERERRSNSAAIRSRQSSSQVPSSVTPRSHNRRSNNSSLVHPSHGKCRTGREEVRRRRVRHTEPVCVATALFLRGSVSRTEFFRPPGEGLAASEEKVTDGCHLTRLMRKTDTQGTPPVRTHC